jgi:hypothetical protein
MKISGGKTLAELKDEISRNIPARSASPEYYGWEAADTIARALVALQSAPNKSQLLQVSTLVDVQSAQLGKDHQSVVLLRQMYAIVAG